MCEESLDSKLSSTLESTSGDILTSGLSNDNSESALLAKAFWEVVWPHLQENGWERRVSALLYQCVRE